MADTIHSQAGAQSIGTKQRVRQTVKGLGLGKLGSERTRQALARRSRA